MRSGFLVMLMVAVIFGAGYWYYVAEAICPVPLTYKIGSIDERFNTSDEEVRNIISGAESMWEDATGRNLFTYADDGKLTINFVFDERQENANEEEELKTTLEDKENMSEGVRAQYEELLAKYGDLKMSYEKRVGTYEKNLDAYNAEVAEWNTKGGAPKDEFDRLKETEEDLDREQTRLNAIAADLNAMVRQMNAVSARGNSLITDYNEVVEEYNDRFSEGHEFTQGEYESKTINIYQFDSQNELEVVLAHEFGHALSLEHVEGETSVMYHIMGEQSKEGGVTDADVTEFERVCGDGSSVFESIRAAMRVAL